MEIFVCMKYAPDTSEADIEISKDGRDIKKDDLDFDMNNWDRFAIEEAVQLKEKHGGKVTVVTVGQEEAEEMLRECLARGADEAFLLCDEAFEGSDGFAVARILAKFIRDRKWDLALTGTLADDDGAAQVGGMLAALLDAPGATLAYDLQVEEGKINLKRELEGGLSEKVVIQTPAVISVATGLNEPRFVSIRAVRKVASAEIPIIDAEELGVEKELVGPAGSRLEIEKMELPPEGEGAEIIPGSTEDAAKKLAEILKEKGGIG
jgi:electron transfer flavoprotein beta subunit